MRLMVILMPMMVIMYEKIDMFTGTVGESFGDTQHMFFVMLRIVPD